MWAVFRGDAFFPLFLVWSEDLDILIFFNREIDSRLIPSIACVASVSVRFRRKERGTRVKDREKSGASIFHFLALVSFLARSKPKVPFLGISLPRNQTETLATQALPSITF